MRKITKSYARIDELVESHGEVGVVELICSRVAEGDEPYDVARSMGLTWMALRRWMESDDNRMAVLSLAKRCYADKLVWDAVRGVRESDAKTEDIQLSKLRADTYLKVAGKLDRGSWGDAKEDAKSGITVVVNRVGGEIKVEGDVLTIGCDFVEGEISAD